MDKNNDNMLYMRAKGYTNGQMLYENIQQKKALSVAQVQKKLVIGFMSGLLDSKTEELESLIEKEM